MPIFVETNQIDRIMKAENEDLKAGYHAPLRPLDAKVPTKITLDGDCALRLADMAKRNNCSKSDIVNALIGRYRNTGNIVSELCEYEVLGCLDW